MRPKCSHRCISLKEFPFKRVLILKHANRISTEQTSVRTKWFKRIAIQIVQGHLLTSADCKRGQWKGATSKSVNSIFDTFRQFSRRAKNVKNRQKMSKIFSTLFDNFRAAPVFRRLLGGSLITEGIWGGFLPWKVQGIEWMLSGCVARSS